MRVAGTSLKAPALSKPASGNGSSCRPARWPKPKDDPLRSAQVFVSRGNTPAPDILPLCALDLNGRKHARHPIPARSALSKRHMSHAAPILGGQPEEIFPSHPISARCQRSHPFWSQVPVKRFAAPETYGAKLPHLFSKP